MKKVGKFWEVADFKDFVTNGKVEFLGLFRRFSAKNALFLYFCKVQILTRICLKIPRCNSRIGSSSKFTNFDIETSMSKVEYKICNVTEDVTIKNFLWEACRKSTGFNA